MGDHFEILSNRSSVQDDCRFRLRVLSPAGASVNYGATLPSGEERDLRPSDTLTVGEGASLGGPTTGRQRAGLHFTFIPFVGDRIVGKGSSFYPSGASLPEKPRSLPDFDEGDDDFNGGPLLERTIIFNARPSNAGVLRPSVLAQLEPAVEEEQQTSGDLSPWIRENRRLADDSSDAGEFRMQDESTTRGIQRVAACTIVLAPPHGLTDKEIEHEEPENYDVAGPVHETDDLFSRTGFAAVALAHGATATQSAPSAGPRRRLQESSQVATGAGHEVEAGSPANSMQLPWKKFPF